MEDMLAELPVASIKKAVIKIPLEWVTRLDITQIPPYYSVLRLLWWAENIL